MCSLESFPFDYTKVDLTKLKESKNMVPLIFQKERDRIGGKRQTDRQTDSGFRNVRLFDTFLWQFKSTCCCIWSRDIAK